MDLKKLIKENVQGFKLKKSCSCGCNTCEDKRPLAPILNESIAPREILSEGLKHHITQKKPLTENVYRAGSINYFNLWAEARALYSRGILEIQHQDDLEILTETNLGEFGILEDGTKVPLDFPMEELDNRKNTHNIVLTFENDRLLNRFKTTPTFSKMLAPNQIKSLIVGNNNLTINNVSLNGLERMESMGLYKLTKSSNLTEAKNENKPLNKPMRGGPKKFYVYVRDPKTKNIKKINFGDSGGLKTKIHDPKARKAFATRHKCGQGEEKTSPKWWSCRIGRYWKQLGGDKNFSGFW